MSSRRNGVTCDTCGWTRAVPEDVKPIRYYAALVMHLREFPDHESHYPSDTDGPTIEPDLWLAGNAYLDGMVAGQRIAWAEIADTFERARLKHAPPA